MLAGKFGNLAEELQAYASDLEEGVVADTLGVRGFHEGIDPFLDHVGPMGVIVDALREVADDTTQILAWPFTDAELLGRAKGCVGHLHESLGHTPTDRLHAHADITREARAFLAELSGEDEDGFAAMCGSEQ